MWEYILAGALILFAIAFVVKFLFNRDKNKLVTALNNAGDFKYKWFSFDVRNSKPLEAIGIDDTTKKVLVLQDKAYEYSFEDIRGVEIVVNDAETINKSTLNTLGRAAIGGLLLGGIGAIAGAFSGSSKVDKKIKKLELKLKTKSLDKTGHLITFFDSSKDVIGGGKGVEANNPIYQKAAKSLEEWFEKISVITEMK